MDWNCFRMLKKEEEKKTGVIKMILIVIGAVVAVAAAAAIVYKIFKKYFTITFECGDCSSCDEGCFDEEEDEAEEPLCCDEDEAPAPEAEA